MRSNILTSVTAAIGRVKFALSCFALLIGACPVTAEDEKADPLRANVPETPGPLNFQQRVIVERTMAVHMETLDTEVPAKAHRRRFTADYKQKILREAERCQ